MHICTRCGSLFVQPVEWFEEDRQAWFVVLRCPDCELLRGAVFDETAVAAYDDELDRGTEVLEQELAALTRERMREYAKGFIYALAGDHIEPMDF
jgi:hypothetical protein